MIDSLTASKNGRTMTLHRYSDGTMVLVEGRGLGITITEEQLFNMFLKESIERRLDTTGKSRRITDIPEPNTDKKIL